MNKYGALHKHFFFRFPFRYPPAAFVDKRGKDTTYQTSAVVSLLCPFELILNWMGSSMQMQVCNCTTSGIN